MKSPTRSSKTSPTSSISSSPERKTSHWHQVTKLFNRGETNSSDREKIQKVLKHKSTAFYEFMEERNEMRSLALLKLLHEAKKLAKGKKYAAKIEEIQSLMAGKQESDKTEPHISQDVSKWDESLKVEQLNACIKELESFLAEKVDEFEGCVKD